MKYNLLYVFLLFVFSAFSQKTDTNNCKYPFDASADSLVKFVIKDIYKYNSTDKVEIEFNSKQFKKYFYDSTLQINYDSVFQECIQYLKEKLGKDLVCQNIDMYINSFTVSENKKDFSLSFGFNYPVLKRETPVNIGRITSYYERINIIFKYSIDFTGKVSIYFPQNIPECNNKKDCGIVITREKAIELLNSWGLIKENDKVLLEVQGLQWNVTLTQDDLSFRSLSINLQTGEFSNFRKSQRIDY